MINNKLLGVKIKAYGHKIVLEKIIKFILNPEGAMHIVSLNPENLIVCHENREFKRVVETAQIQITDGVGIVWAAKTLGIDVGERSTGTGLMEELVELANKMRLTVGLIGGKGKLAEDLSNCYSSKYPRAKFFGLEGVKDIKKPKKAEEEIILSIVADRMPQIIFVCFGSPYQELWIDCHRDKFKNMVVMGVGGAFDFHLGRIIRAPKIIRQIGMEWLFRLIIEPWRWKRQTRLLRFAWLVFKQKRDMVRETK